ncbi:hypothetical protein KUTeg_007037 [Tegillarca granosa]|uniref:Uncharacterized protein n=1 Tax=Tegillarca granosa TaxID=220873 RepID=A0ABQ9FC32_TEGGR|nr:hypothetical protein KUTeg_007037 [Tegillarca granosa]
MEMLHVVVYFPLSIHELVNEPPLLLLISIDGFRHDYLDMFEENETANFQYFIKNGVKAKQVINVFPSSTFPNHMTLLTGVYPETHGVTHNNFYDPNLNDTFYMNIFYQNLEPKWFDNGAEPIWVTNQKGGPDRKSGSLMWPGGLTTVKCIQPKVLPHAYLYNTTKQITYKQRIDYIIKMDEIGHQYGPASKEVKQEILKIDKALGYLKRELEAHGLLNKMNIIITADHGMVGIENGFINLDDYLKPDIYTTPVNLSAGHNMVTPQIVPKKDRKRGAHGYDPAKVHEVRPFFIASGPAFKKGLISNPFHMVDIYSLMCHILKVKPAPNNGSLENVMHLLVHEPEKTQLFQTTTITCKYIHFLSSPNCWHTETLQFPYHHFFVVLVTALVIGVFVIGVIRQSYIMSRHRTPQHRMLVKPVNISTGRRTHSLLSSDEEDDDEF